MIIESGCIVAAGLLLTFWKANWRIKMFMLSNPLMMDILIFGFLTLIHWGTFSGVMVAAVGALACSGMLSLGRFIFGYAEKGKYFPGRVNVVDKLRA